MNQAFKVALVIFALVGIFIAGAFVGGVIAVQATSVRLERLEDARRDKLQAEHRLEQGMLRHQFEMGRMQLQRQLQQAQQKLQQQQQQQRGPQQARALPGPEQFGPQLMQRFVNQINPRPSPEERDKIRPLVNQAAEELRRLRRDTAHSTELILQNLQDQIAAVLTPEQRDRFTDAIQRWRDAFQKYNAEQQQRQAQARLLEQQQQQRRMQRRQQQGQEQGMGLGAVPAGPIPPAKTNAAPAPAAPAAPTGPPPTPASAPAPTAPLPAAGG